MISVSSPAARWEELLQRVTAALSRETIAGQESRMNQGLHRCMMDGFMHRMMLCRGEDGPMVGWMNRSDDVWTDGRMDEGITGE